MTDIATELASGYVSLTVRMAKGGMADVTKEVKKAGTDGGKAYSDEFNKKVEADVGKKLPDAVNKAAKGGGGWKGAAQTAAEEFGKGMLEGIEQQMKKSGGGLGDVIVQSASDGLKKAAKRNPAVEEFTKGVLDGIKQGLGDGAVSDALKNITKGLNGIGDGIGEKLSPIIETANKAAEAVQGIATAADSVKAIKSGDLAGGLTGLSEALKGLGQGGLAKTLEDAGNKGKEAGDKIRSVTDPIEELGKGTALEKWTQKAGALGSIVQSFVGVADLAGTAGEEIEKSKFWAWWEKHDPQTAGEAVRNWFLKSVAPISSLPIPVKLSLEEAHKQFEQFFSQWSTAVVSPQIRVPGQSAPGTNPLKALTPSAAAAAPKKNDPLSVFAPTRASGGAIAGPGGPTSDIIPFWGSNGEHVFTAAEVAKMGGHKGVYAFRSALNGFSDGGAIGPDVRAAQALVGIPYSQASRNDCSGMVAQIINSALGMPGTGLMSTKTARTWLAARGFKSGPGGPGTIRVGWYDHGPNPNDGHMAMTLSDGTNAEAGGSHAKFVVGAGAKGANWGKFDNRMYLPTVFGEGPASTAQTPAAAASAAAQTPGAAAAATSSPSSSFSLPSTISGLSSFGLNGLGKGVGTTGSGSDLSLFGNAAGTAVSGQVSSALGVLGVNDSPGWLNGLSRLASGISVGGTGASPGGTSPHLGNGQQPGPPVVYNIQTATIPDAFTAARKREDERAAAKLSRFGH